ncbi:hypothetical protein CBM2600_B10845 [Cupriavidus taiwanensis]|nr:hypothetical protein CBM2600_B10845 [Cupriavidus taiwanensis]
MVAAAVGGRGCRARCHWRDRRRRCHRPLHVVPPQCTHAAGPRSQALRLHGPLYCNAGGRGYRCVLQQSARDRKLVRHACARPAAAAQVACAESNRLRQGACLDWLASPSWRSRTAAGRTRFCETAAVVAQGRASRAGSAGNLEPPTRQEA